MRRRGTRLEKSGLINRSSKPIFEIPVNHSERIHSRLRVNETKNRKRRWVMILRFMPAKLCSLFIIYRMFHIHIVSICIISPPLLPLLLLFFPVFNSVSRKEAFYFSLFLSLFLSFCLATENSLATNSIYCSCTSTNSSNPSAQIERSRHRTCSRSRFRSVEKRSRGNSRP